MSDQNLAVVKKIYQCFAEDDVSGILEYLTEDITWDHGGNDYTPESPINKLWEGKSGAQSFFETLSDTQDVLAHDVHEFFTSENKVAVTGFYKGRVKKTGKEFSSDWAQVWEFENGLAKAWKLTFNFTAEALAYK